MSCFVFHTSYPRETEMAVMRYILSCLRLRHIYSLVGSISAHTTLSTHPCVILEHCEKTVEHFIGIMCEKSWSAKVGECQSLAAQTEEDC